MKTKKIEKKLVLKKEIITKLDNEEMKEVQGAGISFLFSCICSLIDC